MPRPVAPAPRSRRRLPARASLGAILGLGLVAPGALSAADAANRVFDVPAGDAIVALKQFSVQSGEQLLYSVDDIQGVRTRAVQGDFTAIAALNLMLDHTTLRARQDEKTKAISIVAATKLHVHAPPARQLPGKPKDPLEKPTRPSTFTPMKNPKFLAMAATWLLAGGVAPAQPLNDPTKEEAVVLSPFTVNTVADRGYLAGESLIGGRMATELAKTPSDTTILTKEFLDDIGANNYQDALGFLTSATNNAPVSEAEYGNAITFRGAAGGFPARNYFRNLNSVDFYIAERLESARGPNALLFGDGSTGGVLNTNTKRAKIGRSIDQVKMTVDNLGGYRVALDFNRSLGPKAAVRLNLLEAHGESWIETVKSGRRAADLAVTYRPWKQGEFRFEAEIGNIISSANVGSFTDNRSFWSGVGYNAQLTPTVLPVGTFRNSTTADRLTYDGFRTVNYRGYTETNGTGLGIDGHKQAAFANFPTLPRDFTLQPQNLNKNKAPYDVLAGFYQHEWTEGLYTEVAYQYAQEERKQNTLRFSSVRVDPVQTMADGTANPRFGQYYSDYSSGSTQDTINTNKHWDMRMVNAYQLPISWWKQRVSAFASRRTEVFDSTTGRVSRTNGLTAGGQPNQDLNSGTNFIYWRAYFSDRVHDWSEIPADDKVNTWRTWLSAKSRQENTLDSFQVSTVASVWKDRITFVGGVRRDFYQGRTAAAIIDTPVTVTAANQATYPNYPIGSVVGTREVLGMAKQAVTSRANATTKSGGFTFFPIKPIGTYVNYSETFNTQGSSVTGNSIDGTKDFATTTGTGWNSGIRFNLFNEKLVASLGYYQTKEAGIASSQSVTEINALWTAIGMASSRSIVGFRDSRDQSLQGVELDLVGNPTSNLRLRGNFAFPKTTQTNTLPGSRAYLNVFMPYWQNIVSNPTVQPSAPPQPKPGDPAPTLLVGNPANLQANIDTLNARLVSANEGRLVNGLPDYTASFYANYTIPSGFLKRVGVGLGATFVGRTIIGNQTGQAYNYIKNSARYVGTASLSYNFRIRNKRASVQLNVANLFNYADPSYTSVGTAAVVSGPTSPYTFRNGFYYLEPRKFTLSTTVDL